MLEVKYQLDLPENDFFRTDGYFFMGQQNCPICFPNTLYHSNLDSFTEEFMI